MKTLPETPVAAAQRHLRIHAQMPSQVDHGKQQVAQFRLNRRLGAPDRRKRPRPPTPPSPRRALGSNSRQFVQSKPDLRALAPSREASASAGIARCTESSREAGGFPALSDTLPFSAALISSQLRSTAADEPSTSVSTRRLIARCLGSCLAKDMRMAAHQLACSGRPARRQW